MFLFSLFIGIYLSKYFQGLDIVHIYDYINHCNECDVKASFITDVLLSKQPSCNAQVQTDISMIHNN